MEKKRTLTITQRTREVFVIRGQPAHPMTAWCEACATEVRMLSPDEAAPVTGRTARAIYRQVESGQLHFTETPAGRLLICLNSLTGL